MISSKEILGLNKEFENLKKKPVIMKRVKYLETALSNAKSENSEEYAQSVLRIQNKTVINFDETFCIWNFNIISRW